MKNLINKVNYWMAIEVVLWTMTALWSIMTLAGLMNVAGDAMTTCWQWTIRTLTATIVVREARLGRY